jgi:hypothetical protein
MGQPFSNIVIATKPQAKDKVPAVKRSGKQSYLCLNCFGKTFIQTYVTRLPTVTLEA